MDRVDYDEFSYFHENATEFGIELSGKPRVHREEVRLREGRSLSSLVWGEGDIDIVFLHGGAQNAHTWDSVILALDRAALAIDLPGHGHSGQRSTTTSSLVSDASDIAQTIDQLATDARVMVGMSLGGLTALALSRLRPDLVRNLVLVDVTPGVTGEKAKAITAFIDGPSSFASFDEILERTVAHNPTRSLASLRRGILHNALQLEDGSWIWRYARAPRRQSDTDYAALWEDVSSLRVPLMLVRGMSAQSVVDDRDEIELITRSPNARVEHLEGAGHSVQGDRPVELARLISNFLKANT